MDRTRTRSSYSISIEYKGEYLNTGGRIGELMKNQSKKTLKIGKMPSKISTIFKTEKTDAGVTLFKGYVSGKDISNCLVFEDVFMHEISFEYKTKELKGAEIIENFEFDWLDDKSFNELILFIGEVLWHRSVYVYQELLRPLISDSIQIRTLINLLKVAANNIEGVEKTLKVCPSIIFNNIDRVDFTIGNEGELSKVLSLPNFATEFINNNNSLSENFETLKKIYGAYGSDMLRSILEFVDLYKDFSGRYSNTTVELNRLHALLNEEYGYKVTPLISYLAKQNMSYGYINFPGNEMILLSDYINMSKTAGLPYEKFPSNLKKAHDIAQQNIRVLENEKKDEFFVKAINNYKNMEYRNDELSIVVPKSLNDLVVEGNALNHCVASYIDRVINGSSKIFFVRKNDELELPFVTCELNRENRMIQIRGKNNSDPSEEVMDFANKWLKYVRGGQISE